MHDHGNCERCDAQEELLPRLREDRHKLALVWDWLVSQMMDPHSSAYVEWDQFEDFMTKNGLIEETRYDPERHGPDFEAVEPGDPFWILTALGQRLARAALAPPSSSAVPPPEDAA